VRSFVRSAVLPQKGSHQASNGISRVACGTIGSRAYWLPDTIIFWRNAMNNLAISLAVGASALFMTAASAAPLCADLSVTPESNIQNVRMVCDENGRCWRERGERRGSRRERGHRHRPLLKKLRKKVICKRPWRNPGLFMGLGAISNGVDRLRQP
jgi:hypothetical protein